MRSANAIRGFPLQISDDEADENRDACEKSNQIQNVNSYHQAIIRNERRLRCDVTSSLLPVKFVHFFLVRANSDY